MAKQPDLILCIAGAALCLFGWALYWAGIHLAGGMAGAGLATAIAWKVLETSQPQPHQTLILALAAGAGLLIGIFLLRRVHFGLVALMGAAVGLAIGLQLGALHPDNSQMATAAFALLGATVGAFLFLFLHRYVIILATSAFGAFLLGLGLMPQNPLLPLSVAFPAACVVQMTAAWRFGLSDRIGRPAPLPDDAQPS